MEAYFNRFTITMTKDQAESITQPGQDASSEVEALEKNPKIRRMLDKIDPELIRAELREYGAWEDEDLADDQGNRLRILWIAGGNIKEEVK